MSDASCPLMGMSFPTRTQERETSLLMQYLDVVFPLQFPFYERTYVGKREWLLTVLTSARPTYYATLSLSLLDKESTLDVCETQMAVIWKREKTRYYILALRESQQLLDGLDKAHGVAKLKGSILALACILQLTSFESSNLTMGDWRIHLHAAKSLIPVLTEGWSASRKSDHPQYSIWFELGELEFDATHDDDSISFEYLGALKFFSNVLATVGILSCISIGPSSPLAAYQHLMAQSGLVQLDQFIGCRNWAILAILEVGLLDQWRRKEQNLNRLSLKALSKRATAIEDIVTRELKKSSGTALEDLITNIYAMSALTYLHTVVSGLNPNLMEVQESVTATIVLLKQLPDPYAAQNLVWPLAVTGCMAARSQQDFFRDLPIFSKTNTSSLRDCAGLLKIWEDTWKMGEVMRTEPPTRWEDVINRQGPPILLL